jgi:glutamyl-tRNA synthetase
VTRPVRVRFAPSPTGALHIGGARTAIYNWAFARHHGGAFVLRIDDTDAERSTEENTGQILRSLRWLGLDWDEGPEAGGAFGPYFQTQRTGSHAAALARMKANGTAYPCFCTSEDLEAKRSAARAGEGAAGYDRSCRLLDPDTVRSRIAAGEPHVWRLAVPEQRGDIVVDDVVRGETVFPATAVDDFVLARSDGSPTYNFATVVDDADMEISHVIRGDDHLSNTPKQILVFEALGAEVPRFAHLSMIWGADGKKLSKRHGATSVEAFRDEGILPEALLNYLALLGWSLDGETTIVSAETLKESFSLERISKNPAIFDLEKLEWMNGVYIREMAPLELAERMMPWLVEAGLTVADDLEARQAWYMELVPIVSERIKRMTEVAPTLAFLFADEVAVDPSAATKAFSGDDAAAVLSASADALEALDDWTSEAIEAVLRSLPESLGIKPKVLFQAVRVAVTGSLVSPPLFESLALLGREASAGRLRAAESLIAG